MPAQAPATLAGEGPLFRGGHEVIACKYDLWLVSCRVPATGPCLAKNEPLGDLKPGRQFS